MSNCINETINFKVKTISGTGLKNVICRWNVQNTGEIYLLFLVFKSGILDSKEVLKIIEMIHDCTFRMPFNLLNFILNGTIVSFKYF